MKRLRPPQLIILSFLATIMVGTLLLSLPEATARGESTNFVDTLFTATSATCVTGLIVKDTATHFSPFGKVVILLLFQIGGLGIMTLSTMFAILLGRKLTLRENVIIQSALDHHKIEGLKKLIKYIVLITLGIECVGAALFYLRWSVVGIGSPIERLFSSLFHAVSAFCNAGFSLFSTSFMQFRGDGCINLIMIALILVGGIGFVVLLDIKKMIFFKGTGGGPYHKRLSLQSKIVLSVSLALILLGAVAVFVLENNNVLNGLSGGEKALSSLFHAVTPRTAGFNTLPVGQFRVATLFFVICLMFIGASPGSTGGGIKTATFGVILGAVWAMIHNKDNITMFKRTIPSSVFRRAFAIFVLSIVWIIGIAMVLSITERASLTGQRYFLRILFETTSAFGTVGLTTGITQTLSVAGKLLITLTMFVGRIGPLTLALAVAMQKEAPAYKYPEERVMVG
jgi:trk system potassium uptake protein TrkH